MLLFTGYNGFQQFNALCSNGDKLLIEDIITEFSRCSNFKEKDITLVSASWSDILVVNNNSITIFGFFNDKLGQCVSLTPPFKEPIVQCAYGKGDYFFVTQSGSLWIFNAEHNLWKNISSIFKTEVISDSKPTEIIKVSCGETLTAAISKSGLAYCVPNVLPEKEEIKDVACGKEHGLLLTATGSVLAWGGGSRGQLGHGDLESSDVPSEVEALSGLRVVKIAAGGWHSAALTDEGDLYTWGWNKQGQLAFPLLSDDIEGVSVLPVPRAVELPEDVFVEDVSCGASHTVIKLRDGSVLGCGWNKWGQLGLKGVKYCDRMTLLPLPPKVSTKSIHCGPWCTFILA